MRNKTAGTWIVISLAALAGLALAFSRSVAVEAAYPVERGATAVGRSFWCRFTGMFRSAAVAAENARLRREVASMVMLNGDLDRLEAENARLRKALDYVKREPGRWIVAPVLARHCGAVATGRKLRIGRGVVDGVAEDAAVASPDGLVGLVTAVTPHTAEITLVTDPSVKVACEVEAPGSGGMSPPVFYRGVLTGGSSEELVLSYVQEGAAEAPRARVVTSGRGGVFPRGLEVGVLSRMVTDDSGTVSGRVMPGVDFEGLEEVFVRRER